MSLRYLLDTDWVIHYLNGQQRVVDRLTALRPEGLALSVISLAELYEGVYYSRHPVQSEQRLNEFLESVTLLGVESGTCQHFGRERGRLRAAGQMIGDFDLLIGSIALQHNLVLLTNNRRHFEQIDGLQLESI